MAARCFAVAQRQKGVADAMIEAWQCMAKMDRKAVCESLQTGKRYRFLAKEEIGSVETNTLNVYNIAFDNEIALLGDIAASVSQVLKKPSHTREERAILYGPAHIPRFRVEVQL